MKENEEMKSIQFKDAYKLNDAQFFMDSVKLLRIGTVLEMLVKNKQYVNKLL
jgi:hypothetical protein